MNRSVFKLNRKGVHALLNSPEVTAEVARVAARVVQRAGDGYEASEPRHTGQRSAVNVYPATAEARRDDLANNTLWKVIS